VAEPKIVRIGAGSGGMTDSALGIAQHLASQPPPHYVIFDHMSEGMMSPFLLQMERAPEMGYSPTFLDVHIGPYLEKIQRTGMKIISNAGGLNPHGAAMAVRARIAELGLALKVAVVTGDDLRGRLDEFADSREMFTGQPWPQRVLAANAYFGGFPIAEALRRGADIVITGRTVDSGLALGPLIHEFGWTRDDYDRLAAGTLTGHLLECGTQSSGGTYTDWLDLPGLDDIGYPVAECREDGVFVLTKPDSTGGAVSFGTVAEQILYEVSDPGAYIVPDVICDFSNVQLRQVGPDRVEVTGVRGRAPTGHYKACAISDEGWTAVGLLPVFGAKAVDKARRVAESVLTRTARLAEDAGLPPPKSTRIDLIGSGEVFTHGAALNSTACEIMARVAYWTDDARAARIFAQECCAPPLNGSAGSLPIIFGPHVAPSHPLFCFTFPRDRLASVVTMEAETIELEPETSTPAPGPDRVLITPDLRPGGGDASVPLIALAYGRSGDKGNLFNIAVIARRSDYLPHIRAALSEHVVADWMKHTFDDPDRRSVTRYEAPGLNALNFVLHDTMLGAYGTNLRLDTSAKSMGQQLLQIPIPVPAELARRWDGERMRD
jgi:hypothetical protein